MRRLLFFLALAVSLLFVTEAATAQNRTTRQAYEALTPRAQLRVVPEDTLLRFRTRTLPSGRIDLDEGILRAAYRVGRRIAPALSPEATARAYLIAEAERFGWTDAADLEPIAVTPGRYSTHIRYQQTFYGLPVHNRLVQVNLNRDGQPTMVLSGYAPHLADVRSFNPNPALSAQEALAAARQLVATQNARTGTPRLVVYPTDVPRLAWQLVVWPAGSPNEWDVLIDAHTGDVIYLLDQSTHAHNSEHPHRSDDEEEHHTATLSSVIAIAPQPLLAAPPHRSPAAQTLIDGTGLVFDPDPLTTAGVDYGGAYVDANDTDVPELNNERIEVSLLDITLGTDGMYRLEGPFVTIDGNASIGGTAFLPPAEPDPNNFRYTRSDDAFEAVMAYYHVDKSQRYVQSLDVGHPIQEVPVRVNPHGLGVADDSKYYPAQNGIAFGDGGIDDAEDADVIWHEYAHALLQGSAPGLLQGDEGRSFHEGWADYWAASYSRGLIEVGKVPNHDWRKVFTWDGNEFWSGRVLEHSGHYPEDTQCDAGTCSNSDLYADGLLWATTLMEIYDEIGRETLDRLNLASHSYLMHPVTYVDAAEALIQADLDLYGGDHLGVIIDRLGARGYVDASAYGPIVAHEPLAHTEDTGGTTTILVDVTPVGSPVTNVLLFYSVDGGSFENLELTNQGNNRFAGGLPLPPAAAEITYYLEAIDQTGLRTLLPAGAPQNTFAFDVGPDTEAPVVTHDPLTQVALQIWPAQIVADVVDNQGVDSVWASYTVLQPDRTPLTEGSFGLQRDEDRFTGTFPILVEDLQEGSTVQYRLHARDVARDANVTVLPGETPYEIRIVVEGVLAYFDFETSQAFESTGAWEQGIPRYGVQVAYSGKRVWATGLNVPYPANEHRASLDLPSINLDDLDDAYLTFWHWYDFEHSGEVIPGEPSSGTLWDGANVKATINDGASWVVLEPLEGYNGTLANGAGNPLAGEPAFGGYSYGWRRVIIPLHDIVSQPNTRNVRIRFDAGTDSGNELTSLFYAGWYLDDVRIVTELPEDNTPPTVLSAPPSLTLTDAGLMPPTIVAEVADETGIASVEAEYALLHASGNRETGTLRLAMAPTDLTVYVGTILTDTPLEVGDQIEYELHIQDADGNRTVYPAPGTGPLRIQARLAETTSALRNVHASGLWQPQGQGWTTVAAEPPSQAVSSLVLAPLDLPDNAEDITFTLTHTFRFGSDVGGNVKVSLDGGASWTVLAPEEGYGRTYAPSAAHPMEGEPIFGNQASGLNDATFDLSGYGGRQVRLRIDLASVAALETADFWTISGADLTSATFDQAFETPRELALHPNFPDPFHDNTTITYTLPEAMPVRLELFNILGQRIAVLVDDDRDAGTHTLTMGRGGLASGVYLLRMMAGDTQKIERMIITQ